MGANKKAGAITAELKLSPPERQEVARAVNPPFAATAKDGAPEEAEAGGWRWSSPGRGRLRKNRVNSYYFAKQSRIFSCSLFDFRLRVFCLILDVRGWRKRLQIPPTAGRPRRMLIASSVGMTMRCATGWASRALRRARPSREALRTGHPAATKGNGGKEGGAMKKVGPYKSKREE